MKASDEIRQACERDYILHMEWYCQNPECATREVHITVNDYDRTFADEVWRREPICPICRNVLKLHHVHDRRQADAHDLKHAKLAVDLERLREEDIAHGGIGVVNL